MRTRQIFPSKIADSKLSWKRVIYMRSPSWPFKVTGDVIIAMFYIYRYSVQNARATLASKNCGLKARQRLSFTTFSQKQHYGLWQTKYTSCFFIFITHSFQVKLVKKKFTPPKVKVSPAFFGEIAVVCS